MSMIFSAVAVLIVAQTANAHVSPFAKGMYCLNGVNGGDINAYEAVNPVYQMSYNDYWMHANTGCLNAPPAPGVFLELPAGGSFTVEYASNQAFTSLSYGGAKAGLWPDGADHDDLTADRQECVITPNLHAQNQSMAAGTAFAISYTSDISQVNEDNLVVFTVLEKSPWYREATYQVPADMPACPEGGCICAWGWVPYHCGIPNIYMHPYRCMVTGATGTTAVGQPKSPEWCEDDPSKCVSGPKKFIIWNQLEGNTVSVSGYDLHGQEKSPGYNTRMGFYNGAQNDIFTGGASDPSYSAPSDGKSSDTPSSDDSSSSSGSSDNSSSSSPPADTSSIPEAGIPSNPATDAASAVVDSSPSIPSSVTTSSSATDASGAVCRRRRRSLSKRTENLVANHAHRRHIYNSW